MRRTNSPRREREAAESTKSDERSEDDAGELSRQAIVRLDNASRKQTGRPLLKKQELKDIALKLQGNAITTSLTTGFCDLDDEVAVLIGTALTKNTVLKTLNLWENKIGESGGVGLGTGLLQNSYLTELSLRGNQLGPDGTLGLAKGIMNHPRIQIVNLRYNNIGDYGAKSLAMVMMNNPTITKLDLSRNRISSEGIDMFMKSLWLNATLTELNLQINPINDKGGIAVGTALVYNSTLVNLDIMGCKVGDIGSQGIFEALKYDIPENDDRAQRRKGKRLFNNTLRFLNMGANDIGESECASIGAALATNRCLTQLDLSQNRIADGGATALAKALTINSTLIGLVLADNCIGDAGVKELGEGLMQNGRLQSLSLVRNSTTWRVDIDGFVSNSTLLILENDFNLSKVQADMGHKIVDGFKVDISKGKLKSGSDHKLDIFHHMSKKLISLHCEGNDIGAESPSTVQGSLGEYLNSSGALLELNLSANALKCEHLKVLVFSSLTQLDLSNNMISSSGAEHVITSLAKLRSGLRIREIDFSTNHILKISPMLAYVTSLELLLIRQNPVLAMVPLTAIHAGEEAITQWMHKWATQQLHLSEQTKGNTTKNAQGKGDAEESIILNYPLSPSTPRVQGLTSLCSEYPAIYTSQPCAAVIGMSDRCHKSYHLGLHLGRLAQSPGPANYSPYNFERSPRKSFVRNGRFIQDNWRVAIATTPRTTAGILKPGDNLYMTDELEEMILNARKLLLAEAFESIEIPKNWNSCRHPKIMEAVKSSDPELSHWSEALEWGKPASPGYDEKYGIQSILRKILEDNPGCNISPNLIVQVLKKHGHLHSDGRVATARPHFRQMLDTNSKLCVVPYKMPLTEQCAWHSRQTFADAVTSIFRGRFLEGFTDLFLKQISGPLHIRIMTAVRASLVNVDWTNDVQRNQAGTIIRDVILKGYWAFLKKRILYDSEDSIIDSFNQIAQNPDPEDQHSRKISATPKVIKLFQLENADAAVSSQSKSESTPGPGPGSYYPAFLDKALGPTFKSRIEPPPNTVPGPGTYDPQNCQQDRKIAVGYIQEVGTSRVPEGGPGPAYDVPGCLDKQFSSAPKHHIATRSWFDFQREHECNAMPGPGAYAHTASDGLAEVPIESKVSARSCTSGPAFSHGLPRKLPPHQDADSAVRRTPGPKYQAYVTDRTGCGETIIQDRVLQHGTAYAYSFGRKPSTATSESKQGIKGIEVSLPGPGPGSYDVPNALGAKAVTARQSPAYSMAADTMWRSSPAVSHVAVLDRRCPSTATAVLVPRRPATQRARQHPAVSPADYQRVMDERLRRTDSAPGNARAHQWPPFATMTGTGPVLSPPSSLSRKGAEPTSPGPSTYNVPSLIAARHAAVKNAPPAWPMGEDYMNRSHPDILFHTLADAGRLVVVSPKSPKTARARLHGTDEDSYGVAYAAPTSRSERRRRKNKAEEGQDDDGQSRQAKANILKVE